MASTEEKEKRRAEREEREQEEEKKARRKRRLKIVGGVVLAAIVVVVVAVIISSSKSGKSGVRPASPKAPTAQGGSLSRATLNGIPQKGFALGEPNAPLTITEYADLQCPVCGDFDRNILPRIIKQWVRAGKVRFVFQNFTIIGPQSVPAAQAAAAAAKQGKLWDFVDLWYRNQGEENSGYVTPSFIQKIATGAGLDAARLMRDRNSAAVKAQVKASTDAANNKYKFGGTPSFVLQKAGGQPQLINAQEPTTSQLSAIIDQLLHAR